jgi:D-serine deaminase-like pyridoxal phosphate-dependent protein
MRGREYAPQAGVALRELDTPALLLDLDAFERNVQKMASFFADKSAALRPHAKTHKCPQVALRQLETGAIGITCAKVGEAEVMAQAGVRDILIANQVVGPIKIGRLTELARHCDLMVAVDDADNVRALAQACTAKGVQLRVLVEVDIGMGRCGVQPGPPALGLAQQVSEAPSLRFMGLMGYEGHLVLHEASPEKEQKVREAFVPLQETCELLHKAGLPVQIVSGGGTGTYDVTSTCPLVTEVQAGSYVFMDSTYLRVRPEFEAALTVLSTVVSRPTVERVIVDAGVKAMTREFGLPQVFEVKGVTVQHLSEEHAILVVNGSDAPRWRPGDKIRFLPSHCCTTVNLYDALYIIQDGVLVDVWPIAARGRAQ